MVTFIRLVSSECVVVETRHFDFHPNRKIQCLAAYFYSCNIKYANDIYKNSALVVPNVFAKDLLPCF